ncbi:MAG: PadR family transcriptional regulator [Pseudonocardiaceae bacterium]
MGTRLRKTPTLLAALEALLALDRPYGQEVMERTGRPSGTIYPLLARLEREGWVTSQWESDELDERRPRRRYYTLTPTGEQHARAAADLARPTRRPTAQPLWARGVTGA